MTKRTGIPSLLALILTLLLHLATAPADAYIANIDSTLNHEGNPVSILFGPGIYEILPIGTAQGGAFNSWNPWGGLVSGCDSSGEHCDQGWVNWYFLASSLFGEVPMCDCNVYEDQLLALSRATGVGFTLHSETIINFYIKKDGINGSDAGDNIGGMSLHISGTPVVPEPVSSTLFLVGGATLGLRRFRKKRNKA